MADGTDYIRDSHFKPLVTKEPTIHDDANGTVTPERSQSPNRAHRAACLWGQLVIDRLAARAYARARYPSVGERDLVVNVEGLLATLTNVLV